MRSRKSGRKSQIIFLSGVGVIDGSQQKGVKTDKGVYRQGALEKKGVKQGLGVPEEWNPQLLASPEGLRSLGIVRLYFICGFLSLKTGIFKAIENNTKTSLTELTLCRSLKGKVLRHWSTRFTSLVICKSVDEPARKGGGE